MILTAMIIYFTIGLFLSGLFEAFYDSADMFALILFLWPIVLGILAIMVAVVTPFIIGKWIGDRIKGWF